MKLWKQILAIAVIAILAVGMVACNTDSGTGDTAAPPAADDGAAAPDDSGDTTPPAAASDITVDVFIYDYSDTYIGSVRSNMEDMFSTAGISATFYDGASNQGTQTEQVQTALNKGTDLLIVNIVTTGSEDAAINIVEMAQEKDVPLIFFNREVADSVVESYDKCVFVGTDADEAGYMQGEMIVDLLGGDFDKYDLNGDGKISYIMFKGELGNAEADGRTTYSVQEANRLFAEAGHGEEGDEALTYYDPNNTDLFQAANWSLADAQSAMRTALGTNPFTGDSPIELVIANNDDMALGAIEALNEVQYNMGLDEDGNLINDNHIPVVGVDATDAAQDAIAAQKMDGTIKQDAEGMASCIVDLASGIAAGDDLMDKAGSYNMDEGVSKIRIPYAKFTG